MAATGIEPEAEDVAAAMESFFEEQKQKCYLLLSEYNGTSVNSTAQFYHCPPLFDGFLCWPFTKASTIAILPCPPGTDFGYDMESKITVESTNRTIATKICLSNGQWYRNSEGIPWSNYSLCESSEDFIARSIMRITDLRIGMTQSHNYGSFESFLLNKWLPIVRIVSQIGYATSFSMLVVAMIIFSLLRKLRNPRNRLHMHLFASFIMRAFMALIRDWIFVDGVGLAVDVVYVDGKNAFIKQRNALVCKTITSTWQYFIVANYSWILMEGLYLHNLVVCAFCADSAAINLYILMGWGLPIFVVVPWIIIRATIEDTLCWTTHENPSLFLLIRIPIMISTLFNFLLFVNIVRVLFIKFKTSVHLQRKKMQYSRWAKSTLVLVPLFGAHYTLFMGLSYHKDHLVELVWLFCDQFFASFQGTFVALLYCLLNLEVRTEIKRAWRARWSKNADICFSSYRESRKRKMKRQSKRSNDYEQPSISGTTMRNLFVVQVDKRSNEFWPNMLEMEAG
ncbi:Parathyroid hormone/parathyroid hormone-related peptide receptor [Dufourea novaeangliae]|uniref:Parathyroid hormone/parathyroid hormone-related peptide receptor n=1 Tax=Dufourea novaeangliae TaxID=178035 RepID=A0A154PNK7_DUFNO|nr:Parathyroid hormone/parathyroid hormone-related peptide receptor [Dufourea novaeangliae]